MNSRDPAAVRPAELDQRCYAFAIDRLLAWGLIGAAAYLAFDLLLERDRLAAGIAAIVGAVLVVSLGFATLLGLTGGSPGKVLVGLRVVRPDDGGRIGVPHAVLRTVVLGLFTIPTAGIGLATLAWTAVMDPSGRRRGGHDRLSNAVVVDIRPIPPHQDPEAAPATNQIVNLTALRLMPATVQEAPFRGTPTPPLPEPAEPLRATARWRVAFDTGETFRVEGLVLVGRRPEPRSGEPVRHVVALQSSDLSLSKTHAQFQVVPDGALVVMDRGSTNGSVVVRQGVPKSLTAGRPATLLDGDVVRFGDRTMTVTQERDP